MFPKVLIFLFIHCLLLQIGGCDDQNVNELSCSDEKDCSPYADKFTGVYCSEGYCKCYSRKSKISNECIPKTKISSMERSSKKCNEYPNAELLNGKCVTSSVSLGKTCDQTKQCYKNDKRSECHNQVCECVKNYVEIEKVCRSVIDIEKCTHESQCRENSECYNGKCVCNNGFISSSNLTSCLPFAAYNETCNESPQCEMKLGYGSVCENGTCKCGSNYVSLINDNNEHVCVLEVTKRDSCASNLDCTFDNQRMYCEKFRCRCIDGYAMVEVHGSNECVKTLSNMIPLKSAAYSTKQFFLMYLVALNSIVNFL